MSLYAKFDALMSHLNSEENELAAEFRKDLEKVLDKLEADSEFLNALRCAGVDNWDGYSYAQEMLDGDSEEEEE